VHQPFNESSSSSISSSSPPTPKPLCISLSMNHKFQLQKLFELWIHLFLFLKEQKEDIIIINTK
jgi:hypothetical protein